jgi:hypothetical protein
MTILHDCKEARDTDITNRVTQNLAFADADMFAVLGNSDMDLRMDKYNDDDSENLDPDVYEDCIAEDPVLQYLNMDADIVDKILTDPDIDEKMDIDDRNVCYKDINTNQYRKEMNRLKRLRGPSISYQHDQETLTKDVENQDVDSHEPLTTITQLDTEKCNSAVILGKDATRDDKFGVLEDVLVSHSMSTNSEQEQATRIICSQQIWREKKYAILDEVSMIGAKLMHSISKRMYLAKHGVEGENAELFGGVNFIFLGDFGQLKPVLSHSLYANALYHPSPELSALKSGQEALNGLLTWTQVRKVVLLQQNMRHRSDLFYADLVA